MHFTPLKEVQGQCLAVLKDHIDTDQIIPARFLHRSRKEGFQGLLFRDFLAQLSSAERTQLDAIHEVRVQSKILIAGENFGCGSSREHAVWALIDNGFKAVVAKSFGDIFYGNAINNGLIVAQMPFLDWDGLVSDLSVSPLLRIDLEEQSVQVDGRDPRPFMMDVFFKNILIQGSQEVDMTLRRIEKIESFEQRHAEAFPWLQQPAARLTI